LLVCAPTIPHRVQSLTWDDGPRDATLSGSPERAAGWAKVRVAPGVRAVACTSCSLEFEHISTTEIHAAITIHSSCQHRTTGRQPTACPPRRSLSASQPLRRRLGPGLRVREVRTALARRCLRVASLRPRRHALCPRRAQRRAPPQRAPWLQRLLPGHPDTRTSTTARTRLSLQGCRPTCR